MKSRKASGFSNLPSKRFRRLVSEQKKTVERDFWFDRARNETRTKKWKRGTGEGKEGPLPALLLAPFFARSLTLVAHSLLLNRTETLATQDVAVEAKLISWNAKPFLFAALDPVFALLLIFAMKSSSDLGTACFLGSFFSFLPSSSLNRDCLEGLSLLVSV